MASLDLIVFVFVCCLFETVTIVEHGSAVLRYMIAAVDGTVAGQNESIQETVQFLTHVCAMGQTNIGYIQLPICHSQTTLSAHCKRKRAFEDALLKHDVDFSTTVTLFFQVAALRPGADQRPTSQGCCVCTVGKVNKWTQDSQAIRAQVIGPLPRLAVSDLYGYDSESKPGPAARIEQTLGI